MSLLHRRFSALFLGVFVLIVDLLSKKFVVSSIPLMRYHSYWYPYGGIGVFKDFLGIEFSVVHTVNKGAAWGMLAEFQEPLLWFRIFLIVVLLVYCLFFNSAKAWSLPLALIIAGATGNVIDYFIYGHVVDMFHFILWGYDFPVFNVADSAICVGVCWLAMFSFCTHKKSHAK